MDRPESVKIPTFLNSSYFETYFFDRLAVALEKNRHHVLFDMTSVVWCDLMELLCIPLAIVWLRRMDLKAELVCFRPFFNRENERKIREASCVVEKPRTLNAIQGVKENRDYKHKAAFFWGTLVPFNFFQRVLGIGIRCHLEDWRGNRIPLTYEIMDTFSPKEKSLRYWGIENVHRYSEVNNAADQVGEILDKFIEDKEDIPTYSTLVRETGKNIVQHAYIKDDEKGDNLKPGLMAGRIFSTRGFQKLAAHAHKETKAYLSSISQNEVLSISVVDVGQGIWNALDPDKTMLEQECIRKAFEEFVSSKRLDGSDPNYGTGLFDVEQIINEKEAYLEIRSGQSRYVIMPKHLPTNNSKKAYHSHSDPKLNNFPGVQYRMYVPIKLQVSDEQLSLF